MLLCYSLCPLSELNCLLVELGMENRKVYVKSIVDKMHPENIHLNTNIVAISPHDNGVTLREDNGKEHEYDHVILA